MRPLCLLVALLPLAVLPSGSAITFPLFDPKPYPSRPPPSLPLSFPRYTHRPQSQKGLWVQLLGRAIRLLWSPQLQEARDPAARGITFSYGGCTPLSLPAQYGEDFVLRFRIQSEAEAASLAEAVTALFLDVWEFTDDWVDIRLSEPALPLLLGLLPPSLQRAHTPLIFDLAHAVADTYPALQPDESSTPKPRGYRTFSPALRPPAEETNILFRNYQPLSVLVPWMKLLTSLFPTHVRMISIGTSYEGRDIHALRVGVHPTNSEQPLAPRKTIIVVGGSHAREWISTSSVAYVAYSMITEYGKIPAVTKLLEEFDWVFIPTLNPDGYVYTWKTDRLWRKNRQPTSLRFCKGFDLDRAFEFEWEDVEGNTPCSESYSGDRPFEAVESRRLASWALNETNHEKSKFVGFLDLHSYSQQILYPYSYSCTSTPPSLENLEELGIGLAKAIRLTNGVQYGVTSACEGSVTIGDSLRWSRQDKNSLRKSKSKKKSTLTTKQAPPRRSHYRDGIWRRMESGGGSALDWFYHEVGVRFAYQIKLRDTGNYGFLLPSSYIVPTGQEALSAVRYFGEFLHSAKVTEEAENSSGSNPEEEREGAGAHDNHTHEGEGEEEEEEDNDDDVDEDDEEHEEEHDEAEEEKAREAHAAIPSEEPHEEQQQTPFSHTDEEL